MSAAAVTPDQDIWRPKFNPWLIAVIVSLAAFMEVLECFKTLMLLPHPSNIAIWSLLVGGVRRVEQQISQYGDNSQQLQSALINLSRSLPIAMKWTFDHGKRPSKLASRRWPIVKKVVRRAEVKGSIKLGMYREFLRPNFEPVSGEKRNLK